MDTIRTSILAHNLSIGYPKTNHSKQKTLYAALNLKMHEGEFTCLLGPNGAGKSTLLRTLSNLHKPLDGEITVFDQPIKNYSEQQLATLLGLVLTDQTSVGGLLVSELVAMGRYPYTGFFGKLSAHDHQLVEQAMNDVGIMHKAQSYVAELSDGERQKVMIAKALTQECPIVLLDEPTAFLDVTSRIEIMSLLQQLARDKNKTILLSTHDIELALLLADRLWLLARDKGLLCGATEDVVLSDAMNSFFGSDNTYFNKDTGGFLPHKTVTGYAKLEAEGELAHWTKNLLSRNGYSVTDDESKASISLIVKAKDRIECFRRGDQTIFNCFEELSNWLKINNSKTLLLQKSCPSKK